MREGTPTPGSPAPRLGPGGKLGYSPSGPGRGSPQASGALQLGIAYPVVDRICWASSRIEPPEAGARFCTLLFFFDFFPLSHPPYFPFFYPLSHPPYFPHPLLMSRVARSTCGYGGDASGHVTHVFPGLGCRVWDREVVTHHLSVETSNVGGCKTLAEGR